MYNKQLHGKILACFYAAYLLIAGGICVFMTPPFQVADEPNHFMRAVQIAQGEIFMHRRSPTDVGSYLPQSIASLNQPFDHIAGHSDAKVTASAFNQAFQLKWASPPVFVNLPNTALYPPSSYLGSVLAIKIARHLNILPLATFYFARLGNLAVDGAIGIIALLLAGEAGGFILLVLVLPMSISLTASCSQDGMLLALSAFLAGCLLHFSKTSHKIWNKWLVLALGIAIGCLAAGKAPYIALLPIVWLFGSQQNLKNLALISVLSLGIFLFWAIFDIHGAQVSFGLPNVSAAGQISFLLHHKLHALKMFTIGSVLQPPPARGAIGALGWQDAFFHKIFYQISYLSLALVFINSFFIQSPKLLSKTFALKLILFLGFAFACYDLIFLALYITWTPVGLNVIEGLQGRYLLLILILFAVLPRLAPARGHSTTLYGRYFAPKLEIFLLFAFMVYSTCSIFDVLSVRYW